MRESYFKRVAAWTPTRFWINNPTWSEAKSAIEAGAINCTTNPAYISKLLVSEEAGPDVLVLIDEIVNTGERDASKIAALVQRKITARLCEIFLPLYQKKPGLEGFVSLQLDPNREDDPENFVNEALAGISLMPNSLPKIPVTKVGLLAIGELVERNIPLIATEIMSISQMIAACEAYSRASKKTGNHPAFFVTHITGIFDDYIKNYAAGKNVLIDSDLLYQAGTVAARKQYKIMKERNYPGVILGGGARGLQHFTEFVGGDIHITINWKGTAQNLIETDPPVICRMDTAIPDYVVEALSDSLPDFHKAYYEGGLPVEDFSNFGPVELFRNQFLAGWKTLTDTINKRM